MMVMLMKQSALFSFPFCRSVSLQFLACLVLLPCFSFTSLNLFHLPDMLGITHCVGVALSINYGPAKVYCLFQFHTVAKVLLISALIVFN